jgi:hypothetical protein
MGRKEIRREDEAKVDLERMSENGRKSERERWTKLGFAGFALRAKERDWKS